MSLIKNCNSSHLDVSAELSVFRAMCTFSSTLEMNSIEKCTI